MANKGGDAPRDQEEEEEEEEKDVAETTMKETTTPSKPGRTTWELATGEVKQTTAVVDTRETRAKSQSNVTATRADASTPIRTAAEAVTTENTTTTTTMTTSTLELLDEVLDNREEEHRGADPEVNEMGTSTLSAATTTTTLELLDEVLKAENARRYLTRGSGEHEVLESAGQFHQKGSGNRESKRRGKKKKPADNESLRDEGNSHSKVAAGSGEVSRFKKRLRRKRKKKSRLRHESRIKAEDKQNWPERAVNYNLERRTKEISRN